MDGEGRYALFSGKGNALFLVEKAVQKDLIGDVGWVVDPCCFRLLSAWAGCKERFGNTPGNEIRPDWSKLNPDGSRFQAMALKRHFDGYAVISEAGTASKFW